MQVREIDAHVLDLLVDGESSFASLYFGLLRRGGYPELEVNGAFRVLQHLEDLQLVRAKQMKSDGSFCAPDGADYERAKLEYGLWLPQATASEIPVDEIGLWYEITERGRQAWSQWSRSAREDRDCWMLDDHVEEGILEVRAARKDVAEAVLDRWLAEQGEVQEIPGTRVAVKVPEFVMRDGTRVSDGVLLTCRYRTEKR